MKVKLTPVTSYRVETEEGTLVGTFNKVDEWQGFQRLTSSNGVTETQTIIVTGDEGGSMFMGFLGQQEDKPRLADVITATPGVIAILEQSKLGNKSEGTA